MRLGAGFRVAMLATAFAAAILSASAAGAVVLARPGEETCSTSTAAPRGGRVYQLPEVVCSAAPFVVAVEEEGRLRPAYPGPNDAQATAATFVDPIIRQLKAQAAARPQKTLRILVYAHGGLVGHDKALASAQSLAPAMLADGYAPVFLVWNSDFPSTYWDRLCCIRDGRHDTEYAVPNVASRALGDVAASVARAPQNFGGLFLRFRDSVWNKAGERYYLTTDEPERLRDQFGDELDVVFPPFLHDEKALNGQPDRIGGREALYAALFPSRVLATTLTPEVGAKAWDNMVRRTRLAFRRPSEPRSPALDGGCKTREQRNNDGVPDWGGFAILFDRLDCEIQRDREGAYLVLDDGRRVKVELHFYGHSMGALVGNEAIAAYPDLPWRRVVYMAAATTMRDFRLTAAPVLARSPDARFFHLVLHPLNEARETFKGGVAPSGSLLEWIDEMFEGPRSPDERAFGKWSNTKDTLDLVPDDLRRRTTVRVFPKQHVFALPECAPPPDLTPLRGGRRAQRCHPVIHGEFNNYSFWRDAYLTGRLDPSAP